MIAPRRPSWALALATLWSVCGCGGEGEPPPAEEPPPEIAAHLVGAYELVWNEEGPGQPRQELPDVLIAGTPGCIWARWGWLFAEDGALTISNEMLCATPSELGEGHGVCRAETGTTVEWTEGGFDLPAPVRATARFVNLRPSGSGPISATVRCNVSVGAMEATLEDVEAGEADNRPAEVTLHLAEGGRMHLRAVADVEADHAQIIRDHAAP